MGLTNEDEYDRVVAAARDNPAVVGLILTGSRGRNAYVRPGSDWDVRLIVRDEAFADQAERLGTPHGSPVEVAVTSLQAFTETGEPGSETEWDRYSYVRAPVVIDTLDGRIEELVAAKSVLPPEKAPEIAAEALDAYINSYFRSLKNAKVGLDLAAQLDAAESIGPLLTTIFAIEGRVRPFNRFLRWELESFPLLGAEWSVDVLLPRVQAIVTTGRLEDQAALFRDVEALARAHGLGGVIDGWEPDVAWLRSGRSA